MDGRIKWLQEEREVYIPGKESGLAFRLTNFFPPPLQHLKDVIAPERLEGYRDDKTRLKWLRYVCSINR